MSEDLGYSSIGTIIIFSLLLIYAIGGAYMEKIHCPFGHETGLAIITGFLVSLLIYLIKGSSQI